MVTFNFKYAPGVTLEQMKGFELAGRIWSSYLTDNVEVNLYVEMTDRLATNVLGGAIPRLNAKQDYADFREKLTADATSADDLRAISTMESKDFGAWFDLYDNSSSNSGSAIEKNNRMNITSANSKALGITLKKGNANQLDGYLTFNKLANQSVTWSYNYERIGAAPANQVDFLSTVLHEMGHVLGFVSSVDRAGWISPRINDSNKLKDYESNIKQRIQQATPLDLFRYSTDSGTNLDLSVGGNIFLSLDKGQQAIASFSSGKDTTVGGDGSQASHWKGTPGSSGLMDPTLGLGERSSIERIDLRALDITGWNIAPVNAPLNLSSLLSQAKQSLAQRLGTTVATLEANPTMAQRLTQDLTAEVMTLIDDSEVYDKGRRKPDDPFGQILDVLGLEGVFEEWMPEEAMQTGDRYRNQLIGTVETDMLSGLGGDDQLIGQGGNDFIQGGRGVDRLIGGNGKDVLIGGRDRDILTGGNGRDVFVLQVGAGLDVIQDFQDGKDFLGFSESLKVENLSVGQSGQDTLIAWQGQAIALLRNVNVSQITSADFVIA
jgi:RTX calcium-binding nonapeptide repeat (4 copies)